MKEVLRQHQADCFVEKNIWSPSLVFEKRWTHGAIYFSQLIFIGFKTLNSNGKELHLSNNPQANPLAVSTAFVILTEDGVGTIIIHQMNIISRARW
jgi:hypothetical protein